MQLEKDLRTQVELRRKQKKERKQELKILQEHLICETEWLTGPILRTVSKSEGLQTVPALCAVASAVQSQLLEGSGAEKDPNCSTFWE